MSHGDEPDLTFLLCTDGVGACLSDSAVEAVLDSADDPRVAVQSIVRAALSAGAPDNVTAMIAHVTEGSPYR